MINRTSLAEKEIGIGVHPMSAVPVNIQLFYGFVAKLAFRRFDTMKSNMN